MYVEDFELFYYVGTVYGLHRLGYTVAGVQVSGLGDTHAHAHMRTLFSHPLGRRLRTISMPRLALVFFLYVFFIMASPGEASHHGEITGLSETQPAPASSPDSTLIPALGDLNRTNSSGLR